MTWEFSLIKILLKPKPKIILISFCLLRVDLIGSFIYLPGLEHWKPSRVSLQFDPPSPPPVSGGSGPTRLCFDFCFSDQINKIHKVQFF